MSRSDIQAISSDAEMQIRSAIVMLVSSGCAAFILCGCHSAASDWRAANDQNTLMAYQRFLVKHPSDAHAEEARAMISYFEDDAAWGEARHVGTIAGYRQYLELYPQGFNADAASALVYSIERAAAWANTNKESNATSLKEFLVEYPTGPEADMARAQLNELTTFRVRLAPAATEAQAQRNLRKIADQLSDQLPEPLVVIPSSKSGSFFVVASRVTAQTAKSVCRIASSQHEICEIDHQTPGQ